MLSFFGCSQELTRGKAEKLIKEQNDFWGSQTQTIKIVEGSMIPIGKPSYFNLISDGHGLLAKRHEDINDVYRYLSDQGYLELKQVIKEGETISGQQYVNEFYSIVIKDEIKKRIAKITSEAMQIYTYKGDRKFLKK